MKMNWKVLYVNGNIICLLSMIGSIKATIHYGNHMFPETTEEAIFDLICIIGALAGYILSTIGWAIKRAN